MALKFIITSDGNFRFGDVNMHKDLLKPHENCLGGGMYEFDYASSKLVLYGKSYDFGRPLWHLMVEVVIPASLQGLSVTYDDIPLADLVNIKYK